MSSIFDGNSELKRQLKQNRGLKRTETDLKEKEGFQAQFRKPAFFQVA
jgi:hypothetical protein